MLWGESLQVDSQFDKKLESFFPTVFVEQFALSALALCFDLFSRRSTLLDIYDFQGNS